MNNSILYLKVFVNHNYPDFTLYLQGNLPVLNKTKLLQLATVSYTSLIYA